ncbi:DUF4244 domain-containing protein [Modestobacter sp. Leaf380]|uniref:DUF4244 domain-containing protein n=1 Tax=Modestobacter sp. Leaf380 TaxID=1736356 RepID=UPI000AB93358|nr:DUF4244 domain-containing protein [Modestobacter sp. Leaf380]
MDEQQTVDGYDSSGTATAGPLRRGWARLTADPEEGMSTAEYAVGTVAACAFAAVLYQVVTGGSVVTALTGLVADALATLG